MISKGATPPTVLFARRMERSEIAAQRKAYGRPTAAHSRAQIRTYPRNGALPRNAPLGLRPKPRQRALPFGILPRD